MIYASVILYFQLMSAERRIRTEVEDLRQQVQTLRGQEADRRRPRLSDDEAARKIRRLEETVAELQKNLAAQKQVCLNMTLFMHFKFSFKVYLMS